MVNGEDQSAATVDDAPPNTEVRSRYFCPLSSVGMPTALARKVNRRRIYSPKVLRTMLLRPHNSVVTLPPSRRIIRRVLLPPEVRLMVTMLGPNRDRPLPTFQGQMDLSTNLFPHSRRSLPRKAPVLPHVLQAS